MDHKMVEEAIGIMNENYKPHMISRLEKEEHSTHYTVTLNDHELELLSKLVSGRIGECHNEWYDTTHDDYKTAWDMAYQLSLTEGREMRLQKLYKKLSSAKVI